MAQVISTDVEALRGKVAGQVLLPGEGGYDEARTVWNGAIDRRPAVIVRCTSAADVSAAIGFARAQALEVAVRGGAHSSSGASVVDDGLMIDLSPMHDVTVDPATRRCLVGGGATLGQRDSATQAHGLATTAGIVGHTGVAGLTLGGGMGWLTRKHGLALDNVVSAEVVTADGRILRASKDENADLFWAIRGGGGNFGVVTTFEFQLHRVGPMVRFGMFYWPLDRGRDILRLARELIPTVPRDVNVLTVAFNAPPAPFVPPEHQLQPGYAMLVTGFDDGTAHEAVVARLRQEHPAFELLMPLPYAELQQMFDESNAFGVLAYDKATYIEDISDGVIDVLTEFMPRKTSPGTAAFFFRLDGAYSEVGDDDTAFGGGRSPRYNLFVVVVADNQEVLSADREWARSLWAAMQPHSMGSGSYVNAEPEFTDDRVRSTYGPAKYERLAQIKAVYDPDNVFHRNANIPPAPQPPRQRTG